ncbi:MAG: YqeG family HAD IIIA-type phosphatase [Clostridiales bacterium]|nr:YqeG family HAD IIIA-type phosphatase [Clostridiales bacterium]MCF8021131.1 YqeG family HAD IIIA-type phosphatase [Clostridiales bacterium]
MKKLFYPDMYLSSLCFLDCQALKDKGINNILMDLDNTIIRRDSEQIDPEINKWVKELLQQGFSLAVVSNNSERRVNALAGKLNILTVSKAMKPTKRAFRRGMELLNSRPENTAVLGDQIFTDILGGNRLGLFTILVAPLEGKEFWATRHFNRRIEKLVLMKMRRYINKKTGCIFIK